MNETELRVDSRQVKGSVGLDDGEINEATHVGFGGRCKGTCFWKTGFLALGFTCPNDQNIDSRATVIVEASTLSQTKIDTSAASTHGIRCVREAGRRVVTNSEVAGHAAPHVVRGSVDRLFVILELGLRCAVDPICSNRVGSNLANILADGDGAVHSLNAINVLSTDKVGIASISIALSVPTINQGARRSNRMLEGRLASPIRGYHIR
jgi:hypothetical protein